MRRLLMILAVVGALAAPVSAQAGTTVAKQTFDDTFPLCNGDRCGLSRDGPDARPDRELTSRREH